jgi:hypothetical protein
MSVHDPRLIAAVRVLISDVRRCVAPAIAEARFYQSYDAMRADTEESPAERCRRENAEALAYMATLGNRRGAALKAAKRAYPDNPSAHHRVAQRFRRLHRQKK